MRRVSISILAAALMTALLPVQASAQIRSALILPAERHAKAITFAPTPPAPAPSFLTERPRALPVLYAGSVLLQGLDVHLTVKSLDLGGIEANPIMRGVVKRPAVFIAVKTAVAGLTIYAAERLWRSRHRKAAVVLMAVTTGMMAIVGAQNASVVRTLSVKR